ncbi:unnamed protein product, partial [Amoebophrya sp. A25]
GLKRKPDSPEIFWSFLPVVYFVLQIASPHRDPPKHTTRPPLANRPNEPPAATPIPWRLFFSKTSG